MYYKSEKTGSFDTNTKEGFDSERRDEQLVSDRNVQTGSKKRIVLL